MMMQMTNSQDILEQTRRILGGSVKARSAKASATAPATCCSTPTQEVCCEPAEKTDCCGSSATPAGGCGCQ